MSKSKLPQRASLEYLRKLAKDRLKELRREDPETKLADAQLAVARDHGFKSWRALKSEVEKRQEKKLARFFEACVKGDVDTLRVLIAKDPSLIRTFSAHGAQYIRSGLHAAAAAGHADVVRLLLDAGEDPSRYNPDGYHAHSTPLHQAVWSDHADVVRLLVERGARLDIQDTVYHGTPLGWAIHGGRTAIAEYLRNRGAPTT